jgi:hypothetical protein
MNCTVAIKITDYIPKIETIPYQNFICLFTSGENEGQLPLIPEETSIYKHIIKNLISDLKYKIHILDINDMSLIGMCEMIIPFNLINQIEPQNSFVQEQQKKILIDSKTKRKLFGAILNVEDIYININIEIYVNEYINQNLNKKINKSLTSRTRDIICIKNKDYKRRLDGSPRTKYKNRMIMEMNYDRQALLNLSKNNVSSKNTNNNDKIKNKNSKNIYNKTIKNNNLVFRLNNSFNNKEILINKTNKSTNLKAKQNSKKIFNKINQTKDKNQKYLVQDLTPSSRDNSNLSEKNNILSSNNDSNKITMIESLENINISGQKYITKSKSKKSLNNNIEPSSNTLFSTNSTELGINNFGKAMLETSNKISNDINSVIINNNDDIDSVQNKVKNNILKLIEFFDLINKKISLVAKKNKNCINRCLMYKEKLCNEKKVKNILVQKKFNAEFKNFMNLDNYGILNEKFLREIIKQKKSEFKIYQNIFNFFYYEYDILKYKEYEKSKNLDDQVKIELLLIVFKNLLKCYGNISQIFLSNTQKKNLLKSCLKKYGLVEKTESDNITPNTNTNNLSNKKNDLDNKFKAIKEEDEEKEEEIDDIDNFKILPIDNNHISYDLSDKDDENISNKKVNKVNKSDNKKSEKKKLFISGDKSENNLDKKISPKKLEIEEIIKDKINDAEKINLNGVINKKKESEIVIKENDEEEISEIKRNITNDEEKGGVQNMEPKKEDDKSIPAEKVYRKKNRFIRKEKKDIYDEEDIKMQKLLIEEFPKKCREENRFIRINKNEYSFGEEKIKVIYKDNDVVLQLDEGDYTLTEFIDILNEGKEQDEKMKKDLEDNDIDKEVKMDSSGTKSKRKRRKKISENNSDDE